MIHPIIREVSPLSHDLRARFDQLLEQALAQGRDGVVHYDLPVPKHLFLCYLCDWLGYVAHGSPHGDLQILEPQHNPQRDITEFGCRTQIFASPDALWAMWFALLDRSKTSGTANSCTQITTPHGRRAKEYWFAVAAEHLQAGMPLANGYVYICRGKDFPDRVRDDSQEWGSAVPVQPLFRIDVTPSDFPYADAILGYDQERLYKLLETDRQGFPWFNDSQLWVIRPGIYRGRATESLAD